MKSRVSRIKQKKTLNFSAKTKISLLPEDKRKKSQGARKYVCGKKQKKDKGNEPIKSYWGVRSVKGQYF